MVDVLIESDEVLKISDLFEDPEKYTLLSDSIIREIERSSDPRLSKAQSIIRRIRKRDLYTFVDQMIIPTAYRQFMNPKTILKSTILMHQDASSTPRLTEDDIILDWLVLTYAMKDRNPVDNIKFFNKYKPDEVYTINRDQVSLLIPEQYDECTLRIFTKMRSNSQNAQKAFRNFMESAKRENDILYQRDQEETLVHGDMLKFQTERDSVLCTPKRSARGSSRLSSPTRRSETDLTPNKGLTLPVDYEHIKGLHSPLKRFKFD